MAKKPCTGDLVFIGGKYWCVGEKIISKWKHSKLNKTKSKRARTKKNRRRTAKK